MVRNVFTVDSCSLLWQTLCLYSQWDAKDMLVCCCCAPVNHCMSFWLIDLFLVWSVSVVFLFYFSNKQWCNCFFEHTPAWIHPFSTSILKLLWNDTLFMTNKENIVNLFLRSFHKTKKMYHCGQRLSFSPTFSAFFRLHFPKSQMSKSKSCSFQMHRQC